VCSTDKTHICSRMPCNCAIFTWSGQLCKICPGSHQCSILLTDLQLNISAGITRRQTHQTIFTSVYGVTDN